MGASNVYKGYHSFKHSGAILGTTEGQASKKQYVFKFILTSPGSRTHFAAPLAKEKCKANSRNKRKTQGKTSDNTKK